MFRILALIIVGAVCVAASANGGYYQCNPEEEVAVRACYFEASDAADLPNKWNPTGPHNADINVGDDFYRQILDIDSRPTTISPKPWAQGNTLENSQTRLTGYEWNYVLAFEMVAPLRDKFMYQPVEIRGDDVMYAMYTKAFADCGVKVEAELYNGNYLATIETIRDALTLPETTSPIPRHHAILQFLEEGAIDLVCVMTDLTMDERCPTVRAKNGLEDGQVSSCWVDAYETLYGKIPAYDTELINADGSVYTVGSSTDPNDPNDPTGTGGSTDPTGSSTGGTDPTDGGTDPTGPTDGGTGGTTDPTKPTEPTLCTAENMGRCDCANLQAAQHPMAGAETYTWWIDGTQRCITTYIPADRAGTGPLPTMINLNCYGKDVLMSFAPNENIPEADRFGVAMVFVSSPEGSWSWKDALSNDLYPMPCSEEQGGQDYAYMAGMFDHLASRDTEFDLDKIYSQGFSQNGMGSNYLRTCFPQNMAGSWVGGAGLYSNVEPAGPTPPGSEGTCADCKYWPAYPCHQTKPVATCAMSYTNDAIVMDQTNDSVGHPVYLFEKLQAEGNSGTVLLFSPDAAQGIDGGHVSPQNQWDWIVGCLGVTESCSLTCEESLSNCVGLEPSHDLFYTCLTETLVQDGSCEVGCAATNEMLRKSEDPMSVETTDSMDPAPSSSMCIDSEEIGGSSHPGDSECTECSIQSLWQMLEQAGIDTSHYPHNSGILYPVNNNP